MRDKDMDRVSDADRAVQVLQRSRKPLYYRDLIRQVIRAQDGADDAPSHRIAAVYTQLNVDSRFVYHGRGLWGLSAWQPPAAADAPLPDDADGSPAPGEFAAARESKT